MYEQTFVLHYSTSSACFHLLPRCLWPWSSSCLWHWASLLQGEGWQPDGRPRRLDCWVLVCVCCHGNCHAADGQGMAEVVVAPAWFMDGEGGRAEQMFGNGVRKKNPKEEASGGSAKAQAGPSATPSHPHCTDMSGTDVLAAFPLQEPCVRTRNLNVFPLQGPAPKLSFWRY